MIPCKMKTGRIAAWSMAMLAPTLSAAENVRYKADPSAWNKGEVKEVKIIDAGCPAVAGSLDDSVKVELFAGSKATLVGEIKAEKDKCTLTINVAVDPQAKKADASLKLMKDGATIGTIPVSIEDGEVDVAWYVIPTKIMKDNYGHSIDKKYVGIDVSLGNSSGYDVMISSVMFKNSSNAVSLKLPPAPNTSYRLARGTLEKQQQTGRRAVFINTTKVLGTLGTGVVPFFHVPTAKANFSTGVDIFSNPLEKGLELIFPDTLVKELERLDDQYLRDGTVVHNQEQVRTREIGRAHV